MWLLVWTLGFTAVVYILTARFVADIGHIVSDEFPTVPEETETAGPALEPATDQSQIDDIKDIHIPELVEKLPANSWHKDTWFHKGNQWRFSFECNSESRRFFATALGTSPMEAFLIARHRLLAQIREWHNVRFESEEYVRTPHRREHFGDGPRILIVDDDIDLALAMQSAFGQLGCQAEVATSHEGLHRKLAANHVDYIFLDWKLNDEVTSDQVLEKAVRFIDTFSDLRHSFADHRPGVITHSVLDRENVAIPIDGRPYFRHLDHWQKPMSFHEVVRRASEFLANTPAGLGA